MINGEQKFDKASMIVNVKVDIGLQIQERWRIHLVYFSSYQESCTVDCDWY